MVAASSGGTSGAGVLFSIFGVAAQAVSAYYAAQTAKNSLKSQALNLEHRSAMSRIAARDAEDQAQSYLAAGADQVARTTREYGAVASEQRVSTGASGVSVGVGSSAEVAASIELAKQVDALTINKNSVRAAGAARLQRVNAENDALLSSVSASNLRRGARAINPTVAVATTLLTGGAGVGQQWAQGQRWDSQDYRQGSY